MSTITLNDMSALARALVDADRKVITADIALTKAKDHARRLREETIPAAMQELGLTQLTLTTGEKLTIKPEVYASIPEANQVAALKWLEDHGFGGLIKVTVAAQYGRGEAAVAQELAAELAERGIVVDFDQTVHPQTLKAFLREQLAEGKDIPLELFGCRPVWTTRLS
jgi:hypothetical protein